jgi:hypothetical protein
VGDVMPPTQVLPTGALHGPEHALEEAAGVLPNRPTSQAAHAAAQAVLYCPGTQGMTVLVVEPGGHINPGVQQPEHVGAMEPGVPP